MAFHGVPSSAVYSNVTISTGSFSSSSANWHNNLSMSHPITINTSANPAIHIFNPSTSSPVLTIYYDGRIEYTGKPSEAADAFYKSLCGCIDIKAAGKLALEKNYRRAIKRCLTQAKSMSHEDFISMLETELDARNSKAVLMRLAED